MIPKITQTSWYDFGIEPVALIKDQRSLTKRASARALMKYAKTKGQEDLHIIALGAYEGTGFNRNGDCFMQHWCEKNAHYFQDADRAVHRHHKNKPHDPKFGNIKCAAWNPEMKRIELIVGLDIDKCADILDEQDRKGVTNWSMASKQAHDVCTWCKHKASTDADRCEDIPGNIGEINKQGEMCGMENPDPKWFEVSYVKRGADRIGLSLQKAAGHKVAALLPRDYLNLFPDFDMDSDVALISKRAASKRQLIGKLAELEKYIEAISEKKAPAILTQSKTTKIASAEMDDLRNNDHSRVLKLAADKGIIFNADNFFSYVFGDRIKQASIDEVKAILPSIFEKLANDASVLNNETYDVKVIFDVSLEKSAVDKFNKSHSLFAPYISARLVSNAATETVVKKAEETKDPYTVELAKQYVSYKLAALDHLATIGKLTDDIMFHAVAQNRL